uniref:NADH-ubiquinone oxidoreductase chain 2 n=1 Tax=Callosobruchus chinensis TaxID=146774 RepID=A0A343KPT8_CALCS|nr:NADH dehydrogenase subunit 2 [Callosobruchus chinensis]
MMKFHKLMFLNILFLSTLIVISSYAWFSMWIGLEINLLAILPLMVNPKNIYPSEAAMKYFITQTLASLILLFAILMSNSLNMSEFAIPHNSLNFLDLLINSSLFLKTGAAPFHAWFPEVMEGLNWSNCLLMMTWQKIAPMMILIHNLSMFFYLTWIILISSILSGIMGLNQTSLRKILAYSSINHIAWMLSSMLNFKMIWLLYFTIYTILTMNLVIIFYYFNIFYSNQFYLIFNSNKLLIFFFSLNFLSLGGLPPFLGFLPKWLTILNLVMNQFYSLTLILIISTLITLYFYIRLNFSSLLINKIELIVKFKLINNFWFFSMNFISLAGLLVYSFIPNFF